MRLVIILALIMIINGMSLLRRNMDNGFGNDDDMYMDDCVEY